MSFSLSAFQTDGCMPLVYNAVPLTCTNMMDSSGWRVSPKQDHLVCFLGGSLMLGATTTGTKSPVSVPPDLTQLSEDAQADWKLGEALIETCVDTYTASATYVP